MNKKILFYDIETTPLKTWVWRLGEQLLRHDQLDKDYSNYNIICIAYKFDNEPVKVLHWDYNKQDDKKMIRQFDEIASRADVVIGKNSDRFDIKHINTQRLLAGLPGLPDYFNTDDVEKQFRKYFMFPSYSLDYLSKELLGSGKMRMEMKDWIDIVEKTNKKSFYKMLSYCKKDVEDTFKLWKYAEGHFKPKFNHATFNGYLSCRICGSNKLKKNGTRVRNKTIFQMFHCNEHGGYAGECPITKNGIGKLG
jgi:hypothetical protein